MLLNFPECTVAREEYVRCLDTTGCIVKMAHARREFSGFEIFDDGIVEPLYPMKHKETMKWVAPSDMEDTLKGFFLIYSLSSKSWVWRYRSLLKAPVDARALKLWGRGMAVAPFIDLGVPEWLIE